MRFEVDTGRVGSTARSAKDLLTEISNERKNMFGAVEALNGMWVGEAHDTFTAQCAADNREMQTLVTELLEIAEKYSSAGKAYENCESSALEMIAALQV